MKISVLLNNPKLFWVHNIHREGERSYNLIHERLFLQTQHFLKSLSVVEIQIFYYALRLHVSDFDFAPFANFSYIIYVLYAVHLYEKEQHSPGISWLNWILILSSLVHPFNLFLLASCFRILIVGL